MLLSRSFEFWSFEFVSACDELSRVDFGFRISSLTFMVAFSWIVDTEGEGATEALGERLASCLAKGDILALHGELGAGKTCLVRGIARGLGIDEGSVASPSFTLINEYPGRVPLVHLDGYRLDSAEAFEELGLEDYFEGEGVLVMEWAEKVPNLPEERIDIAIQWVDEKRRHFRIRARGKVAERLQASDLILAPV
jgi:tRNA threonylcarbamoyladenosine biosynthesis protein TsaE